MTTFNENLEENCQFDPNKLGDLGGDLNEVRLFGSIDLVHQKPKVNLNFPVVVSNNLAQVRNVSHGSVLQYFKYLGEGIKEGVYTPLIEGGVGGSYRGWC